MIDDEGATGQAAADQASADLASVVGCKAAWVTPTLVQASVSGQTACSQAANAETSSSKNGS